MNWRRVSLEVRTIRVTFHAAYAQTRKLPAEERPRAVAALVHRTQLLLKDVRDRAAAKGSGQATLAVIDEAADEAAALVRRAA